MTTEHQGLAAEAATFGALGAAARKRGEETVAEEHFRDALRLALEAAKQTIPDGSERGRLEALREAAGYALDCGEVQEARRLVDEAFLAEPASKFADDWVRLRDVAGWPDAWLVAAVRRDPPDTAALDALAGRHWRPLFGRCQLLTVNCEQASDLAQEAWCRVLRARRTLKPGGNFPAYLATIATNLWRDRYRAARRAGPMAEYRLESLDASHPDDDGESVALIDRIADLRALPAEEQRLLAMDIDRALQQLRPQLREVLVARFITGESCVEIGKRYGRTEQSISGWVRQALREMKPHLEGASRAGAARA